MPEALAGHMGRETLVTANIQAAAPMAAVSLLYSQPACQCSHRHRSPLTLQAAVMAVRELSSPQWKKSEKPNFLTVCGGALSGFKRVKKVGNFSLSNSC